VSDHKHRQIATFVKCKRCQDKFKKKRAMINELGFESVNQYQNWKKVMMIVVQKKELILYTKN